MVYFIKALQSGKGLVVAEKKLTTTTVMINGVEREFRDQGGRIGFIATINDDARTWNLEKDDELPFRITDKPVRDKDNNIVPNLYWAEAVK